MEDCAGAADAARAAAAEFEAQEQRLVAELEALLRRQGEDAARAGSAGDEDPMMLDAMLRKAVEDAASARTRAARHWSSAPDEMTSKRPRNDPETTPE